jgi:hypothetical protein
LFAPELEIREMHRRLTMWAEELLYLHLLIRSDPAGMSRLSLRPAAGASGIIPWSCGTSYRLAVEG